MGLQERMTVSTAPCSLAFFQKMSRGLYDRYIRSAKMLNGRLSSFTSTFRIKWKHLGVSRNPASSMSVLYNSGDNIALLIAETSRLHVTAGWAPWHSISRHYKLLIGLRCLNYKTCTKGMQWLSIRQILHSWMSSCTVSLACQKWWRIVLNNMLLFWEGTSRPAKELDWKCVDKTKAVYKQGKETSGSELWGRRQTRPAHAKRTVLYLRIWIYRARELCKRKWIEFPRNQENEEMRTFGSSIWAVWTKPIYRTTGKDEMYEQGGGFLPTKTEPGEEFRNKAHK